MFVLVVVVEVNLKMKAFFFVCVKFTCLSVNMQSCGFRLDVARNNLELDSGCTECRSSPSTNCSDNAVLVRLGCSCCLQKKYACE